MPESRSSEVERGERRGRIGGWDRSSVAVVGLLALALLVRLALAMPVHKYPADADGLLVGMGAFKVLRGEAPVFFAGTRIGSLECYFAAAAFALFGAGRAALLALGAVLGTLLVVVLYLFAREAAGRQVACWSLLFSILPPLSWVFWTYVPNGYATLELLSAVALWLAARLVRRGPHLPTALLFGLNFGLGVWHSLLTLAVTGPALAWMLWVRRDLLRSRRAATGLVLAALLGAAPWIAFNVRTRLGSFHGNFGARPASTLAAAIDNTRYFATYSIPELVASLDPENSSEPARLRSMLRWPAMLVVVAATLWWLAGLRGRPRTSQTEGVPGLRWLPVLAVLGIAAINIFSEAGQSRGLTVRYVLQIWLVMPLLLGAFVAWLCQHSRVVAVLAAVSLVAFYAAGLRWLDLRQSGLWRARAQADQQLMELLQRERVEVVVGPYWTTLPVGFLSHDEIVALPCHPGEDHLGLIGRLPKGPTTFGLVSWTVPGSVSWVDRWAQLQPTPVRVDTSVPTYAVALSRAPVPEQFLAGARAVCLGGYS